jgi:predicted metallopeptidase
MLSLGVATRPNLTLAVKRLIRDMSLRLPELAHVRASRVLVVAGEARRASRATIRPLPPGGASRVRLRGREVRYVITLRPRWFLESSPTARLDTVLHELYHASLRFDGRLHGGRRHSRLPGPRYQQRIRVLRERYLAVAPAELLAPLAFHGQARARMWLEQPPASGREAGTGRAVYTERQLYLGPVELRTSRRGRASIRLPSP